MPGRHVMMGPSRPEHPAVSAGLLPDRARLGTPQLLGLVLLFVGGYFLSYYFRTVNAVLSERLTDELVLDARQLGLMTSAYFLMAAVVQLPVGMALDRFGPRLVQTVSLLLAAAGAYLFSSAHDFETLFAARSLIGLGVASALMAGMKVIATACPPERIGLFNGLYIAIGAAGALAASMPTEALLAHIGWRTLFVMLALAAALSAMSIFLLAPRSAAPIPAAGQTGAASGFNGIYRDAVFWRLAPLSAMAIGSAWALQGLWSAPWLRDVAGLSQDAVAGHLLVMAIALSAGALGYGVALARLAHRGFTPAGMLAAGSLLLVLAELGIASRLPVPPVVLWTIVGAFGAATVLSYTMTAAHFPKEIIGRANGALNLLHFGAAFAIQAGIGQILQLWPRDTLGHYPPEAYKAAFLALAAVQLVALLWFLQPLRAHRPTVALGLVAPAHAGPPRLGWQKICALLSLLALAVVVVDSLGTGALFARARLPAAATRELPDGRELSELRRSLAALEARNAERDRVLALQRDAVDELRHEIARLQGRIATMADALEEMEAAMLAGAEQKQAAPELAGAARRGP